MIGTVLGALGAAYGLAKDIQAERKQAQYINEQEANNRSLDSKNEAWYNRNYYGDAFSTGEARNAMRRVEESLRKGRQAARGRAVVNGSTQEAQLAQQAADNKTLENVASSIAAGETARKRAVDNTKLQLDAQKDKRDNALLGLRAEGEAQRSQNAVNLMSKGLQTVAGDLGGVGKAGSKKADAGTPAAAPIEVPSAPSGDGVDYEQPADDDLLRSALRYN